MQIVEIVFSPTGGTKKVSAVLSGELTERTGAQLREIDLSDPFIDERDLSVNENDLAIIAMPCFGGRVPAVAIERLTKIKGCGAKCVVANVYGNRDFDDALLEMKDAAQGAGFEVIAAIAAIAEHSIMHQFAPARPDAADSKTLRGFAPRILERMSAKEGAPSPRVPGNNPYKKAGAAALVPKITGSCISCGKCAESCPVTAIDSKDYVANKKVCIACMRCIQVCPQNARSISKLMVKVASVAIKKAASVRKECTLYL